MLFTHELIPRLSYKNITNELQTKIEVCLTNNPELITSVTRPNCVYSTCGSQEIG